MAVVDHGGFTAASKAVFVSQPALSLAVKELESAVGTALFTRVGRGVKLTPAGEALLGPARQVLRGVESGRAAVAAVTGLLAGSLSLASLPTLAAEPMAQLVGLFRRHHSGIRVDLAAPEHSRGLFELVESGGCELALTDARAVPKHFQVVDLGIQELVFILPPGADPSSLSDSDQFAAEPVPFVAAPEGTSTRGLLDLHVESLGVEPLLAVVTTQQATRSFPSSWREQVRRSSPNRWLRSRRCSEQSWSGSTRPPSAGSHSCTGIRRYHRRLNGSSRWLDRIPSPRTPSMTFSRCLEAKDLRSLARRTEPEAGEALPGLSYLGCCWFPPEASHLRSTPGRARSSRNAWRIRR